MKIRTKKKLGIAISLLTLPIFACSCTPKASSEDDEDDNGPVYVMDGDKVSFGSYPQSKVEDKETVDALSNLCGELPTYDDARSWTSYKYCIEGSDSYDFMWYKDVNYNDDKYRAVYFTSYRPPYSAYNGSLYLDEEIQELNGYKINEVNWFKFEPVKWRIISNENGEYFLLSDMVLDSQDIYSQISLEEQLHTRSPYDSKETADVYDNNYKYSGIRKWLNVDFYNSCFSKKQKKAIKETAVDNSPSSMTDSDENDSSKYACENTNDKVFLLSRSEALSFASDEDRIAYSTDYAKCQGIGNDDDKETCRWWLRSPYCYYYTTRVVHGSGAIASGYPTFFTFYGVRPALKVGF